MKTYIVKHIISSDITQYELHSDYFCLIIVSFLTSTYRIILIYIPPNKRNMFFHMFFSGYANSSKIASQPTSFYNLKIIFSKLFLNVTLLCAVQLHNINPFTLNTRIAEIGHFDS